MLEILAPPLRIILMATFLVLAKQGWFTWLTPESAHDQANQVMDFLVVAVPALYALWAGFQARRHATTEYIVEKAAALPEVRSVEVKSDALADSLGPKVVS